MNGELLRVTMTSGQVRDACEQWAESRMNLAGEGVPVALDIEGISDDVVVHVIARKKRIRKVNKALPTAHDVKGILA